MLPDVLTGLVFLALAAVSIKLIMLAVRTVLARALAGRAPVYRQFVAPIVLVFLCVGLSVLSIVGLMLVAASLWTATGFPALGVAYALSGTIADAVAGVSLLRDPEFNPADRMGAGEVTAIGPHKTRFLVDGVVRADAETEKNWTKLATDTEP